MNESQDKPRAVPEHYLHETLNLPDGRDFVPVKWDIPLEETLRFSESRVAMINGRPGAAEERLARKARAVFRF